MKREAEHAVTADSQAFAQEEEEGKTVQKYSVSGSGQSPTFFRSNPGPTQQNAGARFMCRDDFVFLLHRPFRKKKEYGTRSCRDVSSSPIEVRSARGKIGRHLPVGTACRPQASPQRIRPGFRFYRGPQRIFERARFLPTRLSRNAPGGTKRKLPILIKRPQH